MKENVSMRTGFWFLFDDANNEISVYCSAVSGKEYLYVNDKLISKKWSLKTTSRHTFSLGDDHFEIVLYTSILKAQVECALSKNHKQIERYKASYKYKRISPLLLSGILFFLGFGFGVFAGYANGSIWAGLPIVLLVTLITITHIGSNMVIKKIEVSHA